MKCMMKHLIIIIIISLLEGCNNKPVYLIFDNQLPGTVPKIFAENIFIKDSKKFL